MCANDYVAEILGFKIMDFMYKAINAAKSHYIMQLIVHAPNFTFFNNVIIEFILRSLSMPISVEDFALLSKSQCL